MAGFTIAAEVADGPDGIAARIEAELLRALAAENPQAVNAGVVLAARDAEGGLIGGLTGATSYSWLLVKTLWVAEAWRRSGVGTALMRAAEARGRALGVHGVWLDTSSAPARAFYQRLGYGAFGRLANVPGETPEGHNRWFLSRRL